jgi:hypothetical protein
LFRGVPGPRVSSDRARPQGLRVAVSRELVPVFPSSEGPLSTRPLFLAAKSALRFLLYGVCGYLKLQIFGVQSALAGQQPIPTGWPRSGPPVGLGLCPAAAGWTPKFDDFRCATQNHVFKKPDVILRRLVLRGTSFPGLPNWLPGLVRHDLVFSGTDA